MQLRSRQHHFLLFLLLGCLIAPPQRKRKLKKALSVRNSLSDSFDRSLLSSAIASGHEATSVASVLTSTGTTSTATSSTFAVVRNHKSCSERFWGIERSVSQSSSTFSSSTTSSTTRTTAVTSAATSFAASVSDVATSLTRYWSQVSFFT